jgi:hypothetical protein
MKNLATSATRNRLFTGRAAGIRQFLLKGIAAAVALAALIWPAIYNGQPFFLTDTRSYMRAADAAVYKLTGHATAWTGVETGSPDTGAAAGTRAQPGKPSPVSSGPRRTRSLAEAAGRGILLGRSIYYGALLYLGWITSHFWTTVFLQAAAILLVICLALGALGMRAWPGFFYLALGLGLFSEAPFTASFLMPDVFAGIAILSCAVVIARGERIGVLHSVILYVLISSAMLFHDVILLIVASLASLYLLISLATKSWRSPRRLAILALALFTAFAGHAIFVAMVQRVTGNPPLRPPFLTARLIETGYGANYLRATCPVSGFTVCRFASQFPENSQRFLWAMSKEEGGVFFVSPMETRRAISAEDLRFAVAVFRFAPMSFLSDGVLKSFRQLICFPLDEYQYEDADARVFDATFPVELLGPLHRSAAYRHAMPIGALTFANNCFVMLSAAYLVCVLSFGWPRKLPNGGLRTIAWWVIAGVLLNTLICGFAATVTPRYEVRVIWLLPLLVLLSEFQTLAPGAGRLQAVARRNLR